MKKSFWRWLVFFTLLGAIFFWQYTNAQNQGQVKLEIKRGFLTIDGSWSLSIWSISSNPTVEERVISLENILQIKDVTGFCSGHYTTIQAGDLSNWTSFISNQNIFLNLGTVTTILGKDNPSLSLWPTIASQRWSIKTPTTHLFRSIGINCWIIGQYWTTWDIKINIPANQAAGTYRWKLYYLLIDNN